MTSAADEWEAVRYAQRRLRERLFRLGGSRGTTLGVLLAMLVATGAWVVNAVWPADTPTRLADDTAVVLADGRIYVLDDKILYPTTNLTSALLASEQVTHLDTIDLPRYTVGNPRGIPGALTTLPDAGSLRPADWQLCGGDQAAQTFSVGAAPYLPPPAGDSALLSDGSTTWLVTDGARSAVDPMSSLRLADTVVASPTLISLLPQSSRITQSVTTISSGVVCVQSDPLAPFAQPSDAALARHQQQHAPSNNGTRLVMPVGAGLLVRQPTGGGYWLLSHTAELAPIADDVALARLGYHPSDAVDLPPALIALFTPGPQLSTSAAKNPI